MFDRNQTTNVYLHMRLYVQVSFTEISRRLTIKNSTPVCELWCVSTSLFCDQNERLGTRVKARSVHFILKKRRESGAASASPPPTAHLMEGPCHGGDGSLAQTQEIAKGNLFFCCSLCRVTSYLFLPPIHQFIFH